jgi:hypothetical protein
VLNDCAIHALLRVLIRTIAFTRIATQIGVQPRATGDLPNTDPSKNLRFHPPVENAESGVQLLRCRKTGVATTAVGAAARVLWNRIIEDRRLVRLNACSYQYTMQSAKIT